MIYLFTFITFILGCTWFWKFLHFIKPQNQPSNSEKLTLHSMPLTILVLAGLVFYFYSSDMNALHLLYIYPITAFVGQIFFSYIFTPRVGKEYDYYLNELLTVLENKPNKESLSNLLQSYELLTSELLPLNFDYTKDDITREIIIEDEKDLVSVHIQEMTNNDLEKLFPHNIESVNFRGEFRNNPVYTTVYYMDDNPFAVGSTFLVDTESFRGHSLGLHLASMQSMISSDFVSKRFGKPKESGTKLYWKKDSISAVLGLSPGPSLTLFVFNNSIVSANL